MKLVKKWLGEDKPCIRNSSNIALIFVLMLGASVVLTGCADEEYVDEAYYQEEDGEYSGGDFEENGEEYTMNGKERLDAYLAGNYYGEHGYCNGICRTVSRRRSCTYDHPVRKENLCEGIRKIA